MNWLTMPTVQRLATRLRVAALVIPAKLVTVALVWAFVNPVALSFAQAAEANTKTARTGEQRLLPETIVWHPRFQGVSTAQVTLTAPRPMVLAMLRINTQAEGVRFFSTPGIAKPRLASEETLGIRTSTFLTRYKLQAAINAAPYGPQYDVENMPYNVAGLHVHEGELISGRTKDYPALLIDAQNRATVQPPPFSIAGAHTAVGGFNVLLKDGEIRVRTGGALHPRTAAGVSADQRFMWWLVVDGRQAGVSEGASLADLALILRELGAAEAINLDGGGTSAMAIAKNDGAYQLLNRPIHSGIVGNERIAGSHLGIFALPLQTP